MSANTWLVEHLMCGGIGRRQAEAFERALDDLRPAGVSATRLCRALQKIEVQTTALYGQHVKKLTEGLEFLEIENGDLELQLLLFEQR